MAEVEWSGESSRRRERGGCGGAEELEDPGLWRSGAGSGSGSVPLPSAPCCTCRVDQSRRTFVCPQRARTVIGGPEQRARNLRVVGAPFLECRRRFWAPRSTCFCWAPPSWFMPHRLLLFLFCFLILLFLFYGGAIVCVGESLDL